MILRATSAGPALCVSHANHLLALHTDEFVHHFVGGRNDL
jgi:hypothetical protein